MRDKRTYQRERDLAKARLLLDGVDLTPRLRALDYSGGPITVDQLIDADGQPVDVETVKTLPASTGSSRRTAARSARSCTATTQPRTATSGAPPCHRRTTA